MAFEGSYALATQLGSATAAAAAAAPAGSAGHSAALQEELVCYLLPVYLYITRRVCAQLGGSRLVFGSYNICI